tara:strand:+ start:798 stop:1238 length:441 start_codon:yes stop_codon:yes gene_type:complete
VRVKKMITKKQIKLINDVYKEINYLAYTQSFTYQLNEILKINKQEEKAHRGYSDWHETHDTNATVNLMAKLLLCENIIKGSLLGIKPHDKFFSAYDMESSNGLNRAQALGIKHAEKIKDTLNAELIGEFRKLDYAELVSNQTFIKS